jgi:hypothetical protein
MANQIAEFFARIFLKNEISPELDKIIDELLSLNKTIENSKHPELLVQEKARVEDLSKAFVNAGGKVNELSQILTYQGAAGASRFNKEVENLTNSSYNNFRAIGQMDRITREFASGGLNQGLNGLTMFGNSLTRLAAQEGGFKNALTGLASAFTGPAGIVLAVSAVIGFFEEYTKQVKKAEEENNKFIKSLQELDKNAFKIAGGAQAKLATGGALVGIISDPTKDSEVRKSALAELKKLYSDNKEIQDLDIKEKNTFNKQLLTYAINRAATQQYDIENQKNEQNKLVALYEQKKIITAKFNSDFINAQAKFDAQGREIFSKHTIQEGIKEQFKIDSNDINNRISEAEKQNKKFIEAATKFPVINKEGNKELDDALKEKIRLLEFDNKKTLEWAKEDERISNYVRLSARKAFVINWVDTLPSKKVDMAQSGIPDFFIKQHNQTNPAEEKISKQLPEWVNAYTQAINENDRAIKQQYEDSKQFANLISKTLTSDVMNLWAAMQQGKDIGPAIGDMFAKLAEQIAAAALQAALFAAIMDALGFGGAGSSFGDIFGGLLGIGSNAGTNGVSSMTKSTFNAGGITNAISDNPSNSFVLKGNDLVLALQRSNVSLNLRRGA